MKINGEYVLVQVEHQWLPPKCTECNVFGHSCRPKISIPTGSNNAEIANGNGKSKVVPTKLPTEEWQVIRKAATIKKVGY